MLKLPQNGQDWIDAGVMAFILLLAADLIRQVLS